MISFCSDYQEGCHPLILERLAATNLEQTPGYGTDSYCAHAANVLTAKRPPCTLWWAARRRTR